MSRIVAGLRNFLEFSFIFEDGTLGSRAQGQGSPGSKMFLHYAAEKTKRSKA